MGSICFYHNDSPAINRRFDGPIIRGEFQDEDGMLVSFSLEKLEVIAIDTVNVFGVQGEGSLFQQQSDYLGRGWLNIANDGCGNYYVLVLNHQFALAEPVIFVDAYDELDNVYIVASDFVCFLRGLLVAESGAFYWPFDQAETMRLHPDLSSAANIRLPWIE